MDRIAVVQKIINDWASLLGISSDFCSVIEYPMTGCSRIVLKFKDDDLNEKILHGGVKDLGCLTVKKFIEEAVEKFMVVSSMYILAKRFYSLDLIYKVIDSGDHLYVQIDKDHRYDFSISGLEALFKKINGTCNEGIWCIKKDALNAYFMFYMNNDWSNL